MPISTVNRPMGSLPKLISTEKLNEVVAMYEATMPVVALSPLTMSTLRTLSHLFWQSVADSIRGSGMKLARMLRTILP